MRPKQLYKSVLYTEVDMYRTTKLLYDLTILA